jgi:hydrogenase maturation factor
MKTGKLSQSIFERSVLKQFHKEQINDYKGAGNICAFLPVACETETFVLLHEDVAAFAIYMAANALAAKGSKPTAASVNLILTTRQSEAFLKKVMKAASDALMEYDMCLAACQVEVIEAVTAPMAVVTVIGESVAVSDTRRSDKAGQDVVMSKSLGVGATALLARVKEDDILARYSRHLLEQARAMRAQLCVLPEAATAMKSNVSLMYHVNKGGVFAALWEMAELAGVGLSIDLKKIPIRQETIEISEIYDINPYEMLGCGSLLMVTDDGYELVRQLHSREIGAEVIGKTTDNNDRIIMNDGESRFLEPAKPDELQKVL